MIIDSLTLKLSENQYVNQVVKKNLIVIHHTVGGTAKSTFDYWQSDDKRIATAFIVERDGTIYQTFPDEMWAFHIGSKVGNNIDKRSIGIELASEGGLTENKGKLYCFGIISPRTEYKKDPYNVGYNWRGFKYFDAYENEQVVATSNLIDFLCKKHNIPYNLPKDPFNYNPEYYNHIGICGHAHIRSDKSDVHPGFWDQLETIKFLQKI